MFELFRSYCPPEQVRLFCRYQTTKLEHNRRTNMVDGKLVPILYKSMPKSVMGENTIGGKTRELAKICGWENLGIMYKSRFSCSWSNNSTQ